MSFADVLEKLSSVQAEQAAMREQYAASQSTLTTVCSSLDKLTGLVEGLHARLERLEGRLQQHNDRIDESSTQEDVHDEPASSSQLPDGDDGRPLQLPAIPAAAADDRVQGEHDLAPEAGGSQLTTGTAQEATALQPDYCLHCLLQCKGSVGSRCSVAMYCGVECQTADWKPRHKLICAQLRPLAAQLETLRKLTSGSASDGPTDELLLTLDRAVECLKNDGAPQFQSWLMNQFGVNLHESAQQRSVHEPVPMKLGDVVPAEVITEAEAGALAAAPAAAAVDVAPSGGPMEGATESSSGLNANVLPASTPSPDAGVPVTMPVAAENGMHSATTTDATGGSAAQSTRTAPVSNATLPLPMQARVEQH